MSIRQEILDLLPICNPTCVHQWEEDPSSYYFMCVNPDCGYRISYKNILEPREGDVTITDPTALFALRRTMNQRYPTYRP